MGFLNKLAFFLIVSKKRKTPKSAENIEFTALLLFCCKFFMSLSFYIKEFKSVELLLSACFRVFIDSPGCTEIFGTAFFYFCLFTGLFIKGEYETKKFFILEKFARNIHKR
ncbi:MAG: hypothetical protein EGQ78_01180 [Clostridiales bacterium]|nr:hypothetical protein [Clostridiales bacterium]